MTADPAAPLSPPPKPPSGFWKWTKRIGCTLVLIVLAVMLTCCGVTCGGLWMLDSASRNMNKHEVDRILAEGMQNGNVKAMHDRADAKFRERYSLADLQAFLDARPGLLDRASLVGADFRKTTVGNVEFVKVRSAQRFGFLPQGDEWDLVFKVVDGVLVLAGISPGLDEFVPQGFHYKKRTSSGRRRFD